MKPLVFIILDGWGYREESVNNAIAMAKTPIWDYLWQNYPHSLLDASGLSVGLPPGQMGNSEVGHLTMGSGRVIYQDYTRISQAISTGEFDENVVLTTALCQARDTNKTVHVLGLLSPGGVHSHEAHIHALFKLAAKENISRIALHAFLDGRDTPPRSAKASLEAVDALSQRQGQMGIVSLCGRYYAMDRDQRWERIQSAYELLTQGTAEFHAASAVEGLELAYKRCENDEFVKPTTIGKATTIQSGDTVIFMNFRADRARQLSRAFVEPHFQGFKRQTHPVLANFVSLTEYAADLPTKVAFAPIALTQVLGEVLAQHRLRQLRLAETEKYAHVTFFFNGGREVPFDQESRELIPSPRIATYDLQPEMSAAGITKALVSAIQSQQYEVIICNYANADMVGHTGDLSATIKAIETIDQCLRQVFDVLLPLQGELVITADHGNAEHMFDETIGQAHTAHTQCLVPFLYVGRSASITKEYGTLSDIAPTLLYLLGINIVPEMTGQPLVRFNT